MAAPAVAGLAGNDAPSPCLACSRGPRPDVTTYTQTGADGTTSGPLITGLSRSCGGGAALAGTSVTVTCGNPDETNAMFFTITAPTGSKVAPQYLIRCQAPNLASCPFQAIRDRYNNPSFNVVESDSPTDGYSLSWQVPLSARWCACSDAYVAVRAAGVIATGSTQC